MDQYKKNFHIGIFQYRYHERNPLLSSVAHITRESASNYFFCWHQFNALTVWLNICLSNVWDVDRDIVWTVSEFCLYSCLLIINLVKQPVHLFLSSPTEPWDRHQRCIEEKENEREAEMQTIQMVSGKFRLWRSENNCCNWSQLRQIYRDLLVFRY